MPAARGQVLVIVALGIIVLLGVAGIAIDVGRLMAERRHLQTAADAGALAACQALLSGDTADLDAAALRAREVAGINIDGSPAGATATIGVVSVCSRTVNAMFVFRKSSAAATTTSPEHALLRLLSGEREYLETERPEVAKTASP